MGPPGERGEDWFTQIFAAHYPLVVKYGLRRLADLDASIELAQEVFTVAWRRRDQVPDRSLPWLYGVARRLLANQWRARRARPDEVSLPDPELLPDRELHELAGPEVAETLASARAALATLGELDQEILRLVVWEELSVGEAATALGCSRAATSVRLHRARRRLASAMNTTNAATPSSRTTTNAPVRRLAQLPKES